MNHPIVSLPLTPADRVRKLQVSAANYADLREQLMTAVGRLAEARRRSWPTVGRRAEVVDELTRLEAEAQEEIALQVRGLAANGFLDSFEEFAALETAGCP